MERLTETQCGAAVRALLRPYHDDAYSHEVGTLGEWREGSFDGRRGGTRTTPGYPDLTFFMFEPQVYTLTVEVKGYTTRIAPEQWAYTHARMLRGDPHLIVRTPEALLSGLRFLGLLPARLVNEPPNEELPDSAAFLPEMRRAMVVRYGWPLPDYARRMSLVWNSRRRLVQPEHVAGLMATAQAKRVRSRTKRGR